MVPALLDNQSSLVEVLLIKAELNNSAIHMCNKCLHA